MGKKMRRMGKEEEKIEIKPNIYITTEMSSPVQTEVSSNSEPELCPIICIYIYIMYKYTQICFHQIWSNIVIFLFTKRGFKKKKHRNKFTNPQLYTGCFGVVEVMQFLFILAVLPAKWRGWGVQGQGLMEGGAVNISLYEYKGGSSLASLHTADLLAGSDVSCAAVLCFDLFKYIFSWVWLTCLKTDACL